MPVWKILVIMLLAILSLALALGAIIVPMTLVEDNSRWLWLAGLIVATICMGTLLRLFLNSADRAFDQDRRR
jgi:hypothetical protein